MYKIKDEIIHKQEIKKSSFITYLNRIENETEAKNYIQTIRKLHPNATHHCYSFICGDIKRSNDDGEPGNSAGVPILQELNVANLDSIVCVVVRYFGGIKLGVGGLIRAYSSSAKLAIQQATLLFVDKIPQYEITFDYRFVDKIEYLLKSTTILDKHYNETVTYRYISHHDFYNELMELSSGSIHYKTLDTIELEIEKTAG